jgi:hypothetical protein
LHPFKNSGHPQHTEINLKNWISNLESKLASEFSKIKREHSNFFQQEGINNNFTNIALELENYINSQFKNINSLLESQFIDSTDRGKENEILKLFEKFEISFKRENLDDIYESHLILKELDNLKIIYDFYSNKFEEINSEIIDSLKQKFKLYNVKNNSEKD